MRFLRRSAPPPWPREPAPQVRSRGTARARTRPLGRHLQRVFGHLSGLPGAVRARTRPRGWHLRRVVRSLSGISFPVGDLAPRLTTCFCVCDAAAVNSYWQLQLSFREFPAAAIIYFFDAAFCAYMPCQLFPWRAIRQGRARYQVVGNYPRENFDGTQMRYTG